MGPRVSKLGQSFKTPVKSIRLWVGFNPTRLFHAAGIILSKTVYVKSGLDKTYVTLFELHEGALVTITDYSKCWLQIQ